MTSSVVGGGEEVIFSESVTLSVVPVGFWVVTPELVISSVLGGGEEVVISESVTISVMNKESSG